MNSKYIKYLKEIIQKLEDGTAYIEYFSVEDNLSNSPSYSSKSPVTVEVKRELSITIKDRSPND